MFEQNYISQFENLNYDKFKKMALDGSLLAHEKVGFPNTYRNGKESLIWQDICSKLTNLTLPNKLILDIGPGCSQLPLLLLDQASKNNARVVLCDSREMLSQLPDLEHVKKVEGPFPDCWYYLSKYAGSVDAIIVYSVFHYVFGYQKQYEFFNRCIELLAPGGQLLIGDLPNYSKRMRFFRSPAGIEFHKQYSGRDEWPSFSSPDATQNRLDDAMILALIAHARQSGCDSYVVPQATELPMANRREDILIVRP